MPQLGVIYQVESEETQTMRGLLSALLPTTAPTVIRCGLRIGRRADRPMRGPTSGAC